jgi:hypothetical protein
MADPLRSSFHAAVLPIHRAATTPALGRSVRSCRCASNALSTPADGADVGERCQPQAENVGPASGSGRIAARGERFTKVNPRLAIPRFLQIGRRGVLGAIHRRLNSLAPAASPTHNRRMPECKLCGKQLTAEKAAASIFDLRFLPGSERKLSWRDAKFRAARFGPVCPGCLKKQKTVPPTPVPKRRKKRSRA